MPHLRYYRFSLYICIYLTLIIVLASATSSSEKLNIKQDQYHLNEITSSNMLPIIASHQPVVNDTAFFYKSTVSSNMSPIRKPLEGFGSPNYDSTALEGEVFYIPAGGASIPDFSNLTFGGLVYARALNVAYNASSDSFPGMGKSKWFAVRYGGKFNISNEGIYKFKLGSDDGSRLLIDGKTIIDNDGVHSFYNKSGLAYLREGVHEVELDYFQADRDAALQLSVTSPGGKEMLFQPQYGAEDAIKGNTNAEAADAFETNNHVSAIREPDRMTIGTLLGRSEMIGATHGGMMPESFEMRATVPGNHIPMIHTAPTFEIGSEMIEALPDSSEVSNSSISMPVEVDVKFLSRPGRASIFIDGKKYDKKTPSNIELDISKKHKYRIEKSGYNPYEGFIQGTDDTLIQVNLEPQKT